MGRFPNKRRWMLGWRPRSSRLGRAQRRWLRIEALESRRLLAGDGWMWTASPGPPWEWSSAAAPAETLVSTTDHAFEQVGSLQAEGEPANDLVQFAKNLAAAGVKFFGADWNAPSNQQKSLFQDGARFLPFIEVTNPDRSLNAVGLANNITTFPTWEFPDGSRATGVLSLAEIAQRSGVSIPTGERPSFAPLSDVTLFAGSPIQLPIDAYDPNGGPLTITAVSDNPAIVTVTVSQSNPSARMVVRDFGEMVFQLFQDKVPRPVNRFIQLVQSGFYDAANNNPPILFHRVIDGFVIQAGDPSGTGAGGSSLGKFDDQFHLDLQHNQAGVLSYAKAGDDTNDSQFFITAAPQRHLDFNHSVFGQLVEGDSVRAAISRTATNAQDKPVRDVIIESISIFEDRQNGIVQLKAAHGTTGTANVTVTVTDAEGNSFSQTIAVTVVADTFNSAPFLKDIPPITTVTNTPVSFQLEAQDVEGDPFFFDAVRLGDVEFAFEVDHQTGRVTVTPPLGFVGNLELLVGVRGETLADTVDQFDTQRVTIRVTPPAPTQVRLQPDADTGLSNSDGVTNATLLKIEVLGVLANTDVILLDGDTPVASGRSSSDRMLFVITGPTTTAEGRHVFTALHEVNGVQSAQTPPFTAIIDRTAPQFTSTPVTLAGVARPYQYDVQTTDELVSDVTYQLASAPDGMTIDADTGLIRWTPQPAQRGDHAVVVRAVDLAGNVAEQQFTVTVQGEELVQFRVETTRPSGAPATVFEVGESIVAKVFVRDLRSVPAGIVSSFVDLLFPPTMVSLVGDPEFGPAFVENTSFVVQPGRIDDVGGTTNEENRGPDELLLVRATFRAIAPGTATFELAAAEGDPRFATQLVGADTPVPADKMIFTSASVDIFLPFTAQNDLFNVDEDSVALLDVLANDFFHGTVTGPLRVQSLGDPSAGGHVELAEDGRVRYRPALNFFGVETFTYQVTDDVSGTATATVTVQVHPVNDPPTARDDQFVGSRAIPEDSPQVVLDVLANDSAEPDVDELLQIVAVGSTSHGGTVTIAPAGTHLLYRPAANFFGMETFTYTISDGRGGQATATVTIEVTEINDPPVAVNDVFTLPEDSDFTRFEPLANDHSGPDPAEELTITAITASPVAKGTARVVESGRAIEYRPAADFFGNDLFTYTIQDSRGATAVGQIRFVVTPVNDPPTAVDDTGGARFRVTKNSQNNFLDVLANDHSAPDTNDILGVQSVTAGTAGGQVRIKDDLRGVLYTPAPGFVGIDTFQYTIVDSGGLTATATVEVEVLDFLPSSLSGTVYIDANDNGQFDSGELPLPGVRITLTGTDAQGNPVSMSVKTDHQGRYEFRNLAPGNYVVQEEQPPFFIDGRDTVGSQGGTAENDRFVITLGENVVGSGNNFGERGREPRYVRVHELFASRRRYASALLMVNVQANTSTLLQSRGLNDVQLVQANLSPDQQTWSIVLTMPSHQLMTTLPNRPSRFLHPLGKVGDIVLLSLSGIHNGPPFQLVARPEPESPMTGPSSSSGEGEGKPQPGQSHAARVSSLSDDGRNSYPRTVDAVFASVPSFVPQRHVDLSWLWGSTRRRR